MVYLIISADNRTIEFLKTAHYQIYAVDFTNYGSYINDCPAKYIRLKLVCPLHTKLHIFYLFVFSSSFTTQSFLFSVSALYLYRRLRSELQKIRRKGALKTCGSLDRPNIESTESCSRCRSELGKIINRGALCRSCRLRVCKACREFSTHTMDWVCIVCNKQMWVTPHR